MNTTKATNTKSLPYLLIAVAVLLSCLALFYLDHETRSMADLLKPGNLIALLIYFLPTFLICALLYPFLLRKNQQGKSIFLSLLIGLPASFALVISFMLILRMFRVF